MFWGLTIIQAFYSYFYSPSAHYFFLLIWFNIYIPSHPIQTNYKTLLQVTLFLSQEKNVWGRIKTELITENYLATKTHQFTIYSRSWNKSTRFPGCAPIISIPCYLSRWKVFPPAPGIWTPSSVFRTTLDSGLFPSCRPALCRHGHQLVQWLGGACTTGSCLFLALSPHPSATPAVPHATLPAITKGTFLLMRCHLDSSCMTPL